MGLLKSVARADRPDSPVNDQQAAKRFFVSGTVQGVGYRYFVRGAASRLGLSGYTKNLRDGRVEVYAIGSPGALRALRRELERGPRAAAVADVAELAAPLEGEFAGQFSIEPDA